MSSQELNELGHLLRSQFEKRDDFQSGHRSRLLRSRFEQPERLPLAQPTWPFMEIPNSCSESAFPPIGSTNMAIH
ncbi:unnamed protein product [Sphagnum jensenii]|uniref:Uncharacterized protein n=1 Tax=Sphagnum jensenii TaxID=128206 RepID=A0ABP1BY41_9BRYO